MLDVLVAGAGPVGLWLAAELRLHGVEVTVVERRTAPDGRSRAVGMQAGTLDTFATRGLAERFIERGTPVPTGHFGAATTRLDFSTVGAVHPFMLGLGQSVTERLLEEHAVAVGARVLRGQEVVSLTQGPDAVEVVLRADGAHRTVRARWVVGCDGTRSAVRQAAGIDFPGQDTTMTGWLADVELAAGPAAGPDGPPTAPPTAPLAATGPAGSFLAVPIGDGVHRLAGLSTATMHRGTGEPLTLEEVREQTRALLGRDLAVRNPRWLSRYGNATRQAAHYRAGRVLLAGDAAHMFFPAGGQGMNLGIQDAANLGWKLAAVLQGRAPDALLDSYEAERRPAARAVIDNTRAQLALFAAASPEQIALREVWSEALADPRTNRRWARRIAGFDDPLPATAPGAHPLTGTRLAGLALAAADAPTPHPLMHHGRPLLLDLAGTRTPCPAPGPDRRTVAVNAGESHPLWRDVTAVLIRPDARIAWASTEADPQRRAADCLTALRGLCR
ncbi:FAD-dependent monooxygenase [Kitasatospora sp. NPDC048538]|uniref:FAD-dependent monooxygenase n=1 Tax=unclassified Kitasatospora TaxID=2633591 RepID=UPI0033DF7B30